MAKISKEMFTYALELELNHLKNEHGSMANYQANLRHNAGQYNYWPIHKVKVQGVTYYCSPCCKTANSDIAAVKRVCARS